MPKTLFIGVDGGASKCRARISDAEGNVLGQSERKASANIASRKPEAVLNVILGAVRAAAGKAGLAEEDWRCAYAGLGLAGAEVKSACDDLLRLFRKQGYFRKASIRTDAFVTWLGAHGGEDGAILILGTGSCGLSVVDGKERYVSGYGPQISDEASGHWLGRSAVRRALWAFDGRIGRTELAQEILARFHENPVEIITFAKEAKAAAFGDLAPMVFRHAEEGDALAVALVSDAAKDAERMIARLLDLGAPSVYLHGGISERLSRWLRPAVRKHLNQRINAEGVPLEGATLLARRLLPTGRAATQG